MKTILFVLSISLFIFWRFEKLKLLAVLWFYEEKNAPIMSDDDITRCIRLVIENSIVGENAGSKLKKVEMFNTPVLTEDDFASYINK